MKQKHIFKTILTLLLMIAALQARSWAQVPSSIGSINYDNALGAYRIATANNLRDLSVYVNGEGIYSTGGFPVSSPHDCSGMIFKQTANIVCNDTIRAIGTYDNRHDFAGTYRYNTWRPFKGTYDGQGYVIDGLKVKNDKYFRASNAAYFCAGMFGATDDGAVLRNICLVNPSINNVISLEYVYDVAHGSGGSKNSRIDVDPWYTDFNRVYYFLAGIVGDAKGTTIEDCYVYNPAFGLAYRDSVLFTMEGAYGFPHIYSDYNYICNEEESTSITGCSEVYLVRTDPIVTFSGIMASGSGFTYSNRYYKPGSSVTISYFNTTPNGYNIGFTDGQGHTLSHSGSSPNYTVISRDFDIRITPTYNPITYQITYNNVEEATFTTENPITYNVETETFTLNRPRREGYTFLGWTGTDLERVTQEVTISRGSIGDRTYTTQWVEGEDPIFDVTNSGNTFTITRDVTSTQQTVYYRTVSLSAIAGQHFTQRSGILTFVVGESSKNITVTETTPSEDAYKYQTSASRTYRFEVLDEGGFELAHKDRDITSGLTRFSASKVSKSITNLVTLSNGSSSFSSGMNGKYNDVRFTPSSDSVQSSAPLKDYVLIDDSYDYKRKWATVSTSSLINTTGAPASYLNSLGYKIYATVCFTEKEKDDGYQYIQIIAGDGSHSYDGADPNGAVNAPYNSVYKVCFELSNNSNSEGKAYFPHRSTGTDEFSLATGKLWEQRYKSGTSGNGTGCVILDPTTSHITTRFDAGGNSDDTWGYKDFFVRMALCDATSPTVLDNYKVSAGNHRKGNTVYVTIAFSEMVNITGDSRQLITNWGTLYYAFGDGSNVITFKGTISPTASGKLKITGKSFVINDLAGNELNYPWSTSNPKDLGISLYGDHDYTITYTLNGGTATPANPTSYNYSTPSFTLNNPTRTGCDFNGWTGSDLTEASMSVTVENHSHGNRRFIANWTPHTFVVVFNKNHNDASGSMDSMDPMVFVYDEAQALVANAFSRTGCSFDGWSTAPDGDIVYTDGQTASNLTTTDGDTITLYAHWTAIPWAGSGTELDPWQIQYPSQLNRLADSVNNHGKTYSGKYFLQTADLVYDGTTNNNYTPVGDATHQFCGNYNGGGYNVSGINVTRTGDTDADKYVGLFGYLGTGAHIHTLTLASDTLTGYTYTGSIAGCNSGTVSNCRVESTVAVYAGHANATSHGGVVGYNNGTVAGCLCAATVSRNGYNYCNNYGGIVGYNDSGTVLRDCLYTGTTVTGHLNTGGIVGSHNSFGTNNYFINNFGEEVGERRARTVTLGADVALSGGATAYLHSGLTAIGTTALSYNDGNTTTLYSGYNQNLTLTYAGSDELPTGHHHGYGYSVGSDPIDTLASNTFTMPAADVTVAHFFLVNSYTVSFEPNGGSGSMDNQAFTYGVAQNLTANAFTRSGYTFCGWNTSSNGIGTAYTDGQEVSNLTSTDNATITLYAQWTPDYSLWHADADHDGTTAELAYIITTPAGLDLLASLTNGGNNYSGTYFKLGADIAYSYTSDWNNGSNTETKYTPIGNYSTSFEGTFDGQGHTISGIRFYLNGGNSGLFGHVGSDGTVKNVTLADSRITSNANVGCIVGRNYGTVENCHSTATVALYECSDAYYYFGGIVGWNQGAVRGCTSAATVSNNGKSSCSHYGGIVGYNYYYGTVENCLALGANVTANNYYGSVVGCNYGTITNCHYRNCSVNDAAENDLYTVVGGTDISVAPAGTPTATYPYGGIEVYDYGVYYDGTLYAVENAVLSLTLNDIYTGSEPHFGFKVSSGTFAGSTNPYSLTLAGADAVVNAITCADDTVGPTFTLVLKDTALCLIGRDQYQATVNSVIYDENDQVINRVTNIHDNYSIDGFTTSSSIDLDSYTVNEGIRQYEQFWTVTDRCGNSFTDTMTIKVYPLPIISIDTFGTQTVVYGDPIHDISVNGMYATLSLAPSDSWLSFNPTNGTLTGQPDNVGRYVGTVTATSLYGCGSVDTVVRIQVTPRPITIAAGSATKKYDGTPLTSPYYECTVTEYDNMQNWAPILSCDSIAGLTISGSQTYVGSSANVPSAAVLTARGDAATDRSACYAVTYASGTLRVTTNDTLIRVVPGSGSKVYDGTPLTMTAHEDFTVTGVPDALTWEATADGTVTNLIPGEGEKAVNAVTSFRIFDANHEDVTSYFTNIDTRATGTLTVTPDVELIAGSWKAIASPMHDDGEDYWTFGTALTSGSYDFLRYNESTASWENQKNDGFDHMDLCRGYIYRSSDAFAIPFTGQINSASSYSILLTASGSGDLRGFNLVGNPYPYNVTLCLPFYSLNADGTWTAHSAGDTVTVGQGVLVYTDHQVTLTFHDRQGCIDEPARSRLPKLPAGFCLSDGCDGSSNNTIMQSGNQHFAHWEEERLVISGEGTLLAYDMMGRELFRKEISASHFSLPTSYFPGSGVYVLRLGGMSQKIVVKTK